MKFNKKRIVCAIMALAACVMFIAIPNKAKAADYGLHVQQMKIVTGRTPGVVSGTYHLSGFASATAGLDRIEIALYRVQDDYKNYRTTTIYFNNTYSYNFLMSPEISHALSQNMWGEYRAQIRVYDKNGNCSLTPLRYTVEKSLGSYMAGLYKNFLGRDPETKGYVDNMQMITRGQINVAGMVKGFYYSPEYKSKAKPNNDQFVRSLYRGILGRDADAQGYYHYLYALANGANRDLIVNEFLNSQEFKNTVMRDFKMEYYK